MDIKYKLKEPPLDSVEVVYVETPGYVLLTLDDELRIDVYCDVV